MKYIPYILAVVWSTMILGSCIERTDYDHQANSVPTGQITEQWNLAGEFGGMAEVSIQSDDPMDVRYDNDGFLLVSGLCATDDEVWVCDLGISRIQIFDFNGRYLRSIGAGSPIEGTLPSLQEIYDESVDYDRDEDVLWEREHGADWRSRRRELFRAADVVVRPGGYWIADWAKTSTEKNPLRDFGVYFVPDVGDMSALNINGLAYPAYLAIGDSDAAVSAPLTTGLWSLTWEKGNWNAVDINSGVNFQSYMQIQRAFANSTDYMNVYVQMTGAGRETGQYFLSSGVEIAYEKLLICDTGNKRIQVLNLNKDKDASYAMVARVIKGESGETFRFGAPLDIAITADGRILILDSERFEVAVLDTAFNRIGSFGKGDLVEPYAIDLSDDGRHCFVSDRRYNKVFHYVDAN